MKPSFLNPLLSLAAGLGTALLLSACGGGGDDDDRVAVTPPTVAISTQQADTVEVGSSVSFSSKVSSANSSNFTYAWTLAKPTGSQAALGSATTDKASFTPDVSGDYRVSLTVHDGLATSSAAEATVKAVSTVPVANAGADSSVVPGVVQLDGTASQPPDGGDRSALGFQWTLTEKPAGSQAVLDSATVASPRFTADIVGSYKASLAVIYGGKTSASDEVVVNVVKANVPAVIAVTLNGKAAGASNKIDRNTLVTLDASGSYDPDSPADKSKLQYRWSLTGGNGNTAVLSSTTTASTSFTPNVVGSYNATLQIFDGVSLSSQSVFITVAKPAGEANLAPKVRSPLGSSGTNTYEAELGAEFRIVGSAAATDEDYSYPYPIYDWKWISYPQGWDPTKSFNDTKANTTTFTPTIEGDYTVELQVHDAQGAYSNTVRQTYTARLGANRAPTASFKTTTGNTTTLVGNKVTFDATGSSDPDTNKLSYEWTLVDRPDGSAATLANAGADSAYPTLTPDRAGPYTVKLVVIDSHGWRSDAFNGTGAYLGATVSIMAKTENHAPNLRPTLSPGYTQEQPLLINKASDLVVDNSLTGWSEKIDSYSAIGLAANAYDPDGDALTYLWTLTEEPAGNVFNYPAACNNGFAYTAAYGAANNLKYADYLSQILAYRTWNCANLTFAPSKTGRYTVQLAAFDGSVTAGPISSSFYAATRADYPSVLLENLSTQHTWSNSEQKFVVSATNAYPSQELFPYDPTAAGSYANAVTPSGALLAESFTSGDFVVRTYRLTAGGGDYTIVNLKASDAAGQYQPKFVGLVDGQVIRKGESVQFQLVWPITSALPVDEYGNPLKQDGLSWSFGIKEKPAFTFKIAPSTSAF